MIEYICDQCDTTYRIEALRYKCDCGQPLQLKKTEVEFSIDRVCKEDNTLWRYRGALPIADDASIISLGEGMTPLVSFDNAAHDHRLKLDFICPTGSYKDRGAAVLLSKVKELGVQEVVEDSSGNAGAAIAAYSAKARIDCTIYCPTSTSKGKLTQISMYGAKLKADRRKSCCDDAGGPRSGGNHLLRLAQLESLLFGGHKNHRFRDRGATRLAGSRPYHLSNRVWKRLYGLVGRIWRASGTRNYHQNPPLTWRSIRCVLPSLQGVFRKQVADREIAPDL